jgi:hypothetical protein
MQIAHAVDKWYNCRIYKSQIGTFELKKFCGIIFFFRFAPQILPGGIAHPDGDRED